MEKFREMIEPFWLLVVDVWEKGLLETSLGRIFVALGIVTVAVLVRGLFVRIVIGRLKGLVGRTRTRLDDEAMAVLERPMAFIPVVVGVYFAVDYLGLSGGLKLFADRLVRSLIVWVIFWAFRNLVPPLSLVLRQLEKYFTASMVDWLIKAINVALIFIGAATILEIWGIRIGPIIAGLGLFGVAVALGAQDLFKNLIAGMLIIAEKRFNPGDWIKVGGEVEGTVETIGFRSTLIRQFDKAPVYVPNAKLSDNSLINYSRMSHRRIYWVIGVEYRTTVDQLRTIRDGIEDHLRRTDAFDTTPAVPTFVRIDRFSDSSIDIMVYCFTRTTVWGEWLAIKETLACEIKRIVETAGAAFAFPSQSIYVETLPPETPEVFVPENERGLSVPPPRDDGEAE
ncbi:putative MscS family protein YhdY [Desulfosarcina ovata subsp. sediminis]|uniref:Putative MscS family protein YhdY n=1 Tax=Desulfosarcina ovata subsp. sediminis TaxID=885957 RepID=A0A5K7ZX53_9BACT|nr:mechanosensitive ion channel family protein [Desulfosarcina ovata]BBO84764.1 putative MscS family protein YhdY [Desulfosarcina ovata subsp. sediminis]